MGALFRKVKTMHTLLSVRGLLKSMFSIAAITCLGISLAACHVLPYSLMPYFIGGGALLLLLNLTFLVWAVKVGQTRWQATWDLLAYKIEMNMVGPLIFAGALVLALMIELFCSTGREKKGVVAGKGW